MELKKIKRDMISMSLLMVISVLFYFKWIPEQIRVSSLWSGSTGFSSRTFPNALMIALFVVSAIGLIHSILQYRSIARGKQNNEEAGENPPHSEWKKILTPMLVFVLILLYCILFREFGFIVATILVPPILLFVLNCKNWKYYLIVYVFAAILYIMFKIILKVPLP